MKAECMRPAEGWRRELDIESFRAATMRPGSPARGGLSGCRVGERSRAGAGRVW